MRTLTEKDVLKLLADGPTLQQLTQKINQESPEEIPSRSIGDVLITLQNKGHVFLEEGRWWRTPEGMIFLEKALTEESIDEEKREKESKPTSSLARVRKLTGARKDLIIALSVALAALVFKLSFSYAYLLPVWDGSIYLLNARRFLYGYDPLSYFELLRPPLLPCTIAFVWAVFGESYAIAVPIQPIFTVSATIVLYIIVREMFGWKTAMLSFLIFLFDPVIFTTTNQLLTHGVQLLFTLLSIFFAWRTCSESAAANRSREYAYAVLVGFFAALASLTRYAAIAFFPAVLVLVWSRKMIRNIGWIMICGISFVLTWAPWMMWNASFSRGDPFASVKAAFSVGAYVGSIQPWYYYLTSLVELISIAGILLLLVGIMSRRTFRDRKVLTFACWFAAAMAISSALPNKQLRFTTEWFPAIAVLISLGARRIQGLRTSRWKVAFNLLLSSWLIYLVASSNIWAAADLKKMNDPTIQELPTIVSWVTANMAKDEIGASDAVLTPQLCYFARRLFYSWDYLEGESRARGTNMKDMLSTLNVTYVIVISWYAQEKNLSRLDYLVMIKKFQYSMAYAVMDGVGSKHQTLLLVGKDVRSDTAQSETPLSQLAIRETVRGIVPRFEVINSSSFFTRLQDAFAEDLRPKHGVIILLDEVWSEASQSLILDRSQLSILRTLVEEHGVALMTSGKTTQGWLAETHGIRSNGTSTFTSFHITASKNIRDWSNLLGSDRTWNVSATSQLVTFPVFPPNVEAIVGTSGKLGERAVVWAGYQGKGRVAHFCCSASDLSFDRRMITVNPVLVRLLFWLLGDYPQVVKGTGFKVVLRVDDAMAATYASIENHASALLYERGVPLSIGVIANDLTDASAALLLRLKQKGCELVLHGAPSHDNLVTMQNQTEALLRGKEVFKKWLGFYPSILAPPYLSYDYNTVRAAEILKIKAISGDSFESKPPGTRGNHFGYTYSNSNVVMLPTLPLLDGGTYGSWSPSAEVAIARTKWLLASRKWLLSSCIVAFHFNDTRLPEVCRLVDWAKSIGAEFTTMEQAALDTFMSPTLEQYSLYTDASSFSEFDMLENGSKVSFVLKHPVRLRIDAGRDILYYKIDGKLVRTKGSMIVTDLLEADKEHTILIQVK
jgi:peptidoglycan/xylan/chitin deacetylase (PgdA/CDA1 family)/4-amino-4-deoxy-L-arabinose transferase-like glycosyltransferase